MTGAEFLNVLCGSSTVEGLLDRDYNDTRFRATALGWLNLVLKDVSNRQQNFHWRFLEKQATFSTAASDFDYALATIAADIDTTKFIAVYDKTYDRSYKYISYEKLRRIAADESNDSGQPMVCSIFAGNLLLYPRPSAIVTTYIDYIRTVTALADGSTACDVPSKYDSVVIDGVMVYGYRFDPDLGDWAKQLAVYEAGIERMKQDNAMVVMDLPETQSHRLRKFAGDIPPIDTHDSGTWSGS